MVLPGYKQRGGLKIRLSGQDSSHPPSLNLFFYGPLIGLSKDDASLDGYALWSNIQIKGRCDETTFRHTLPDIGLNYADQQRPHLVAPLKLRIPAGKEFSCKKITEVEITFDHLYDEDLWIEHPPKKIKITWKDTSV